MGHKLDAYDIEELKDNMNYKYLTDHQKQKNN